VPVAVGTACAYALGGFAPAPALAALTGALLLQIGANLANDVFDYEKGADTAERVGPTRAVQSGLLTPKSVRLGMFVVFSSTLLVGAYLTAVAGPAIVVIGLASIATALAYTAGPYPLGYHGLGDVFVFIFFGVVAVGGTCFVQLGWIPPLAWWAALPVGSLATAILVVNNLRDRDTDTLAGKRTLAVRFGARFAIAEYIALIALAYAVPLTLFATGRLGVSVLLPIVTLPIAMKLIGRVARDRGRTLNASLVGTAKLLLSHGAALAAGIALGRP